MAAKKYSIAELLCAVVARELSNDDAIAIGLHAELMLTSALLAQRTHAPNLKIRHGLRFELGAELNCAAWTQDPKSRAHALVENTEEHESILSIAQRGSANRICDTFFVSGLQIDREGNTNLIGIKDISGQLRSRGPGSIGTSSVAQYAKKYFIFTLEHSPRRLVGQCDYISSIGYGLRKRYGLLGGPLLCITPLCVFDFYGGQMRLRSIHAHSSLEEVLQKTGFMPIVPRNIGFTSAPSEQELAIIRSIDRQGILRTMDAEMVI